MTGHTHNELIQILSEKYPRELSEIIFGYCNKPVGSKIISVVDITSWGNSKYKEENNVEFKYHIKSGKTGFIFNSVRKIMKEYDIDGKCIREWKLDIDGYYNFYNDKILVSDANKLKILDINGELLFEIFIPIKVITDENNKVITKSRNNCKINKFPELAYIKDFLIYENIIYVIFTNYDNRNFVCWYTLQNEMIYCWSITGEISFCDKFIKRFNGNKYDIYDLNTELLFTEESNIKKIIHLTICDHEMWIHSTENEIEIRILLY